MYNIHIIEDDVIFSKYIQASIKYSLKSLKMEDFSIKTYTKNFESVLSDINITPSHYNIYILDISLGKDSNGIRLADRIRQKDIHGYIIFLTSHIELVTTILNQNLKALNIIYKNSNEWKTHLHTAFIKINEESLRLNQSATSHQSESDNLTISIKVGRNLIIIKLDDLIMVQTSGINKKLAFMTKQDTYITQHKLTEIQNNLPENFCLVHRSNIINIHHLRKITYTNRTYEGTLINNHKCRLNQASAMKLQNQLL